MLINFNEIQELTMPCMNNGEDDLVMLTIVVAK